MNNKAIARELLAIAAKLVTADLDKPKALEELNEELKAKGYPEATSIGYGPWFARLRVNKNQISAYKVEWWLKSLGKYRVSHPPTGLNHIAWDIAFADPKYNSGFLS